MAAAPEPLLNLVGDEPAAPKSQHRYRLPARIVAELREQRRALIEAAPTTLEERDGRTWLVRRLPPGPAVTD